MKLWLIIAVLLSMMGGAAYWYVTTTQSKIELLISNNATLEGNIQTLITANEESNNTIDELQDGYIEVRENYSRLEGEFQEIRLQNRLLETKLDNNDLGKLAAAKPELVERIINNASEKAMRCFELLSGSPLTRDERGANSAKEFNSECPFLWDGSGLP